MLFNANFVVLAALLAAGVHAQSDTSSSVAAIPTGIPSCVEKCATTALKATNGACTSMSVFFLPANSSSCLPRF